MIYDTIIVGAGIAGVSAALSLGRHEAVLVVESHSPASGASGVAAGLFSPMPALRGRPVEAYKLVIEAFYHQVEDAGARHLFDNRGVLRPGHDPQQAAYFKESVTMLPGEAEWLTPEASKERHPHVHAPYGSMFVKKGGAVDLGQYVRYLAQVAEERGIQFRTQTRVTGWEEIDGRALVTIQTANGKSERLQASKVIVCWGRTFLQDPSCAHLNLHQVKGQTIRITRPEGLPHFIPISSKGYVISRKDHIAIGSSFEHHYTTDGPTPDIAEELLQRGRHVIPALEASEIIDAQAGFRVTVPGIRKPIFGLLPGSKHIFAFGGFGSKGLLYAPLFASELPNYLADPSLIPLEMQVRVKSS